MPKSPEFRKVVGVFIASPSDLGEERTRFPQIIAEVNKIKANKKRIHLEPVGWEDTLPGRGRPQKLINKDIKNCELIIMLLSKRWGSSTGRYTSGFEEEYELAKSLNQKTKKPDIWLYFRSVPDSMLADPGEQLRKVLDFRSKVEAEKKFLYRAYESVDEWEKLFREHLCRWLDDQPPSAFHLPSVPPGAFPAGVFQEYEKKIKRLEGELERRASEQVKVAEMLAEEAKKKADLGEITKAEEFFAKAAAVSLDPGIINDYGLFLMRIGMLAKAEERFTQLAQLGQALGERSMEAAAYVNLGILHKTCGDLKKAEEMYKKSLAINEELGAKEGMADGYGNLGILYKNRGDLKQAEEMHKKALAIDEKLGRKEGMACDYGNLGNLYEIRGDLKQAEEMHRKALAIDEELGAKEGMADDYGNLGNLYQDRGDLKGAEEMHKKSLAINKQLGRKEGMARNYGNLGILYQDRGDLKGAEDVYKKALVINTQLGRKEGMARNYGNLGNLYKDRDDLKDAEDMYKKALAIDEELGHKEGIAISYNNLGVLYMTRGDLKGAEDMCKKALAIDEELGRKRGMAASYNNLGNLYQTRGDLKGAQEMYKKALAIFNSFGNKEEVRKINLLIKEVKNLSKKDKDG